MNHTRHAHAPRGHGTRRRSSQSNRSDRGAATQAVLMSIFRTLRLTGHSPVEPIAHARRELQRTGQLPPLPEPAVAGG